MIAIKLRLAAVLAALLLNLSPHAQAAGPSPDQLKSWVTIRQQRGDLVHDEIKQMDGHIKSRLDVIIQTLSSIRDSKESRTKVARVKEETMKRLRKTMEAYDQKRSLMREELRNPATALTAEDKRKII